ncbi:hypothetical protein Taro_047562 [Colocasia esculenta]|uniref:Secreted protein n=1 Tax=Colocasia esculenta TaxID=4460 RepID=A0A843X136_COLES|nr:hypothetical protein [Colocasia esculenta]
MHSWASLALLRMASLCVTHSAHTTKAPYAPSSTQPAPHVAPPTCTRSVLTAYSSSHLHRQLHRAQLCFPPELRTHRLHAPSSARTVAAFTRLSSISPDLPRQSSSCPALHTARFAQLYTASSLVLILCNDPDARTLGSHQESEHRDLRPRIRRPGRANGSV